MAEGADDDIVVIDGVEGPTLAPVIIWTSMLCTIDLLAKLTFERQEILLCAMGHCTVLSEVGKLHLLMN